MSLIFATFVTGFFCTDQISAYLMFLYFRNWYDLIMSLCLLAGHRRNTGCLVEKMKSSSYAQRLMNATLNSMARENR